MVYNRLKREKEPEVQEQADGVRFGGLGLRLEFGGTYLHTYKFRLYKHWFTCK